MSDAIISVRDLHKWYSGVHALKGVSLDFKRGEALGLVGDNGAGKSTLINILSGVQRADQGEIQRVCEAKFGAPPAGMRTNACDTGERMVMPNPCNFPDTDRYAHLLCHELGHANGWPPTHGDFPTPVSNPKADAPEGTTALSSTPKSN